MDGNGRWAASHGLPRSMGHRAGAETLHRIVKYSASIGIKILTVYAFSTENWARPTEEVDFLMTLLTEYLGNAEKELAGKDIRIKIIGERAHLPKDIYSAIDKVEKSTQTNKGLILNIAINYGGRLEIVTAAKSLATKILHGEITPEDINEAFLAGETYTAHLPDPDIIIRPSGEQRLSNFLLWQCAYSELWFSKINWPDFSSKDLDRAIIDVSLRSRRFGK